MKYTPFIFALLSAIILAAGSMRDPTFWRTPDQRGAALMRKQQFAAAAKTFSDPAWIGVAQYRNGDFQTAAKTFARFPGADGAYDQANALLMHGKYEDAAAGYDRALVDQPGWKEAEDNKAIALARQALLDASSKDRELEQADAYDPDKIVFDQKGDDQKGQPLELAQQEVSDEELRATWLRQIQTTPGDFLRTKFAYQAARQAVGGAAQ